MRRRQNFDLNLGTLMVRFPLCKTWGVPYYMKFWRHFDLAVLKKTLEHLCHKIIDVSGYNCTVFVCCIDAQSIVYRWTHVQTW